MKFRSVILLYGAVLVIGVAVGLCAGSRNTTHQNVAANVDRSGSSNATSAVEYGKEFFRHEQYFCIKRICYQWDIAGREESAQIEFVRVGDNEWRMFVRGPRTIVDRPENTVFGPKWSSCSMEEGVRVIDRSLSDFQIMYPNAPLHGVSIEMPVIRDLYVEVLSGVRRRLSTLKGTRSREEGEGCDPVDAEVQRILDKSQTTRAIMVILRKHGIKARGVSTDPLAFKKSLAGQKWSHIATLPDAGIEPYNFVNIGG